MRNALVFTSCLLTFGGLPAANGLVRVFPAVDHDARKTIPFKPLPRFFDIQDAQPVPERDSAALYHAGCERLQVGDMEAAIRLLSQATAKRPNQIEYPLKLADAYVATGQEDAAQRLLENLKKQQPRNNAVLTALARLQTRRGAWPAATEILAPAADSLEPEGILLLAEAYGRQGQPARQAAALQRGLKRFPRQETLWLAHIDAALEQKQYATALQRVAEAGQRVPPAPPFYWRAARAYFALGQALGATDVRAVPDGRAGQFIGDALLIEERDGPQRFLCCPKESALYQIRRALDGGLDEPTAHLLHAQIWQSVGRSKIGLAILKNREAVLLDGADGTALETFAKLAFEAGALGDFLRYARLRAERQPAQRERILYEAYLALAERYNQRGEEGTYLEFLHRALEMRPENLELLLQAADADWTAGRHEDAARLYRRLLEKNPAHSEQSRILQRLAIWQSEPKASGN